VIKLVSMNNSRRVTIGSLIGYGGLGKCVTQSATFLAVVLTLTTVLLLAGCGGQDTIPTEGKEASEEEEAASEAPVESLPSYEPGPDMDTEICQTAEALEDLGPEGLQMLTDELAEGVAAGRFANMQEALASRGYTCNGQVR
jgi:hypothetical protein